jgi:putative transposase
MARLPRLSVAGVPHLVEQCGHNGQALFLDSADLRVYREILLEATSASGVALHAYLLDTARVLLLATPRDSKVLSRMIQRVARRYTVEFNRRHERSGTIWSGRFRSTLLQPGTCFIAACATSVRYSPGKGRKCCRRQRIPASPIISVWLWTHWSDHALFWALGNTPFERHAAYGLLAMQPISPEERRRFDDAVRKGWALGTEAFLAEIAEASSRRVRPLTAGRPRKPT